jgi:hypothetical protein
MRRVQQIAAIAFLVVAAFLGFHASRLRYYTPLGPGPGFFPVWLCVILAGLALYVLVRASTAPGTPLPGDFAPSRAAAVRIAAVIACLAATAMLMPVAGFRLSMLTFYLVLLTLLGRRPVAETLLLALAGSFGVYHVFVAFLNQPLPVGRFGL